ncbi:non-ribosomal peptide synthetase [Pleionea sp. CnH1-48]|uniref:non-ribosomal peptide synthetase n=1 Tax=Pleionea sp. CnH1-48 TaxID=2954494 RepID=UPI00209718E8|nr:non-ribosomal peptide synthetase [Pleionea sp. CnH1-48]MCO7227536.1 amino acid adenylation domain-containing protein [Pleionea sp. CnH1-48]
MKMEEFFDSCIERSISLSLVGENLKINAAPGALTEEIVAELKERKAEIIEWLTEQEDASITKRTHEVENIPLSFSQQRLWVIDQLEEHSAHYNILGAYRLLGTVDAALVESAFQEIVRRHSVLRTNFLSVDGSAQQLIHEDIQFQVNYQDISKVEAKAALEQIIHEETNYSFSLDNEPLLRVHFLRVSEQESMLVMNIHHIISDDWSIKIMASEFLTIYSALANEKEHHLAELDIQFSDFSLWQREQLLGSQKEKQLGFWRKYLSDIPKLHQLPTDYPRPKQQGFSANSHRHLLDSKLYQRLELLANEKQVTPFILLQTAFALFVAKYSNESDIVMAVPNAGRSRPELESLVGFFVNSLVFRNIIDSSQSFEQLLIENRRQVVDVFEHQDIPFELLVEELNVERDLSFNPLCQIKFQLLDGRREESTEQSELSIEEVGGEIDWVHYDLDLSIYETEQGLQLAWLYKTELFSDASIQQMAARFERLLSNIVDAPDIAVSKLEMLTDSERKQSLEIGRGAVSENHSDRVIIHDFEKMAASKPEVTAVCYGGLDYSYSELNEKANKLADLLVEMGVETEERIALCLGASPIMLIAMLAAMKIGAIYVPIDSSGSSERNRSILEDADIEVALSDDSGHQALPTAGLDLVDLEGWQQADWLSSYNRDNPSIELSLENSAYIIYTSGSTGKAKGVEILHSGLLDYCRYALNHYYQAHLSGSIVVTSPLFDITVPALFLPLLKGDKVTFLENDCILEALSATLVEQQNNVLLRMTPLHVKALLALLPESYLSQQKHVFVIGGAEFPVSVAKQLQAAFPESVIYNHYGPTEAVVGCSLYNVTKNIKTLAQRLPIGRPMDNHHLYILDANKEPVAPGLVGELYIAGAGLARGYVNRPELNACSFIDNPFMNGRLYATGDRVRWNNDGQLEYIGRQDEQIKLRGYRIEPGEIEHAIAGCSGVSSAVVVVVQKDERQVLAAYVVAECDEAELKKQLALQLPEYMVPQVFVYLDALPVNANGKVDKHRLPDISLNASVMDAYVAPSSDVEICLVEIWKELLGVEKVGIHDNFFSLGGDSILSIQMISRAAKQGYYFSTRQLFEHQTIAKLAPDVALQQHVNAEQGDVSGDYHPLPVQKAFLRDKTCHHYNQSVMLEVPESLNLNDLKSMVSVLVKKHDALRLCFNSQVAGSFLSTETIDIDNLVSHEVVESIKQDLDAVTQQAQSAIAFDNTNIGKWVLIEAEGEKRLLIVYHHLVIDGVSWRILLSDLSTLWHQNQSKQSLELGRKTSSIKQWSEYLKEYASHTGCLKEGDFWQTQIDNMQPLPFEGETTETTDYQQEQVQWSKELTKILLNDAHHAFGTRIEELLVSALSLAFSRFESLSHVSLLMEHHGREELNEAIDLSETIGWFTNKYPLTLAVQYPSMAERIIATKEHCRSVPHGGIGYGVLSEYVESQIGLRAKPEIQFNYLGQMDSLFEQNSEFGFASEHSGNNIGMDYKADEKINITAMIIDESLSFDIGFEPSEVKASQIKALADDIEKALCDLIDYCSSQSKPCLTPSDFPLSSVNIQELQQLTENIEVHDLYPATGMQQGLLYQSELESDVYVTQLMLTVTQLDLQLFQQAWKYILERHDILKTAFYAMGSGYHQVVTDAELEWNILDLSNSEEQEAQIEEARLADKQKGFDIHKPPLMRFHVFYLAEGHYKILWSHHHAIWDGWCNALLFREVIAYYSQLKEQGHLILKDAPKYKHYIEWLAAQELDIAKAYWKERLSVLDNASFFPQQTSKLSAAQKEYQLVVSQEVSSALNQFAQSHRCTLFTLIQGAWAYLLSRYIGEQRVVFGTVVSGRPAQLNQVEEMIGLFINTIPVVADFSGNENLTDWLAKLHSAHVESDSFSYLPLTDIHQCSPIGNAFDTLFVFENYPVDKNIGDQMGDNGFLVEDIATYEETNFGLTLLANMEQELTLKLKVKTELYDGDIMSRVLPHLQCILEGMLAQAQQPVKQLPMLLPNELDFLLHTVNDTQVDYPYEQRLHELFLHSVSQYPERIAVSDSDGSITYKELHQLTFAIYQQLLDYGVSKEELVAVRLPKGRWQVAATLGIMMSGGAYLPVETRWPDERCEKIIEKAGCRFVVIKDGLYAIDSVTSIDCALLNINEVNTGSFKHLQEPQDLAYVIFTSGSTGQPKGVAIEHRSAVNTILDINAQYEVTRDDKVLAVSALSFDLSVYDIFGLLAVGGEVVFPDDDRASDPTHWLEMVEQHQITFWDTVPVSASLLVEQLEAKDRASTAPIRNILMSGDWIDPSLPKRLWQAFPGVNTYSLGGATEGSIWSIHYPIKEDTSGRKSVPYGKPLSNQSFHIVNQQRQLMPIGIAGELCIGGVGVARCYFGDQVLSRDRFIEHEYLNKKLYRTGDLGRYLPDGNIEFIGRVDHQVKIRGFRIELGEIEKQLTDCLYVKSCLVQARESSLGQKYLAAYVQLEEATDFTEQELIQMFKEQLIQHLPDYMMPSGFAFIEKWPLTANGKVDVKALPDIESQLDSGELVPPSTDMEHQLCQLWAELLEVDIQHISVTRNFMDLGGHSLLAVRMVTKIEQALLIKVDLRQLYVYSTTQALAEFIERQKKLQQADQIIESMDDDEVEEFSF